MKRLYFLITGILLGFLTAGIFAGNSTGAQGIIPSLIFTFNGATVHLHYWVISSVFVAGFFIADIQNRLLRKYPTIYFIIGLLTGLIFQGILMYADWYKIIY